MKKKNDTKELETNKYNVSQHEVSDGWWKIYGVKIYAIPMSWNWKNCSWDHEIKKILHHKIKEFSIESLITRLWIEEESQRQYQKEKVFVVSNKKNKFIVVVMPYDKLLKNQNHNIMNQIKKQNPSRVLITPITMQQLSPQRYNIDVFSY